MRFEKIHKICFASKYKMLKKVTPSAINKVRMFYKIDHTGSVGSDNSDVYQSEYPTFCLPPLSPPQLTTSATVNHPLYVFVITERL